MNAVLSLIVLLIPALAHAAELATPWLYHPDGTPVEIVLGDFEDGGEYELVLMRDDGTVVARSMVAAASFDLRTVLPEIESLGAAAFLQLLVEGEPAGPALVVQPMLSRMVPITEMARSPSGYQYRRVVGWVDENAEEDGDGDGDGDRVGDGDGIGNGDGVARRLRTGYRIYRERDVVLHTDHGDVRLLLRPDAAPNTAWNFRELVGGGFYRNIDFHRIVPLTSAGDPFVIQAGDPSRTGDGGPGYWLPIEPSSLEHDFGVISMARAEDTDSAGSQIFICLSRAGTARLDGSYCSFGETIMGADVIRSIADVELVDVPNGRPKDPPQIVTAQLIDATPRQPGVGRTDRPDTSSPSDATEGERVPR